MSTDHQQQHNEGFLVIPWGAQYDHLLPKIIRPCNHRMPLVDFSTGWPFPMVPVGDFHQVIVSCTPRRNSICFGKRGIKSPSTSLQTHQRRCPNLLAALGRQPALPAEMGNHLKPQAPWPESHHAQSTPHLQRNTMNLVTKTCTAPKDKENSKSPCKHTASPAQGSYTT